MKLKTIYKILEENVVLFQIQIFEVDVIQTERVTGKVYTGYRQ